MVIALVFLGKAVIGVIDGTGWHDYFQDFLILMILVWMLNVSEEFRKTGIFDD